MTDEEIKRMKKELEKDQKEEVEKQESMAQAQNPLGGAAPGGAPGGGGAGVMPPPGAAGGQEPAENKPPTATESTSHLADLDDILILEDKEKEVISRIIQKQQEKVEEVSK